MPSAGGQAPRLVERVGAAGELERSLERPAALVLHAGAAGDRLDQRVVAVGQRLVEVGRVLVGQPEGGHQLAVEGERADRHAGVRQAERRQRIAEHHQALGVGLGPLQAEQLGPGLDELARLAALRGHRPEARGHVRQAQRQTMVAQA